MLSFTHLLGRKTDGAIGLPSCGTASGFVEESAPEPTDDDTIEIELDAEDLDEIEYAGDTFDLGEAVAQSLGLAFDPYAEGPNADAVRVEKGIASDEDQAPSGPLAEALKALKKD